MKRSDKAKYAGIIISLIALAVYFAGFKMVAPFLLIPAVWVVGMSPSKSGNLFFAASFLSLASAGFAIDYPYHTYPAATVSFVGIACVMQLRNWFFSQMYLSKTLAMEAVLINLFVVVFFLGAYLTGYNTVQWISGSLVAVMFSFFSFVIYKDRAQARDMVRDGKIISGKAPDFTLEDQNGNKVNLKEILEKQHALLIFVRGDWCPTCHMMLRGYVKNKELLASKNIRIVGIGPDPAGINKEIMSRIGDDSLMLSDNEQATAAQYSQALQANNPITQKMYKNGIPLPASFLVHQNGDIIYTSRSDKAAEILQPDKIFEALASL
jgi:peroxiredoxin